MPGHFRDDTVRGHARPAEFFHAIVGQQFSDQCNPHKQCQQRPIVHLIDVQRLGASLLYICAPGEIGGRRAPLVSVIHQWIAYAGELMAWLKLEQTEPKVIFPQRNRLPHEEGLHPVRVRMPVAVSIVAVNRSSTSVAKRVSSEVAGLVKLRKSARY